MALEVHWTPGRVRQGLEDLQGLAREIEEQLGRQIEAGAVGYVEIRHEVVEANDAISRALEILDANYKQLI